MEQGGLFSCSGCNHPKHSGVCGAMGFNAQTGQTFRCQCFTVIGETGAKLRDKGTAQVLDNSGDWKQRAREMAGKLVSSRVGDEMTGEDIIVELRNQGLEEPHNHNAWGAIILGLRKSGRLKATGQMRPAVGKIKHARNYPVWRIVESEPR